MLSNYHERYGVLAIKVKNEAEVYLNISKHELKHLSTEECGEANVILTQYAIFIQDMYNKEISRVTWAKDEINRIIAPKLSQYDKQYKSHEEKRCLAIDESDYTRKLEELKGLAQASADKLYFIANRIESLAKAYATLVHTKKVK